ncbi:hypothetical protein PO070_11740 [Bacteroides stercoris]|jgi:hypothetical protein|uniref:hypothetical protein n=1 Tax=Bacteroides stercoris TaxID=46506 RepID=UPI00232C4C70|nr:hypothetical protein [Bacteroides stercoris]MDC2283131.1 hypothetical protein [Bacteroides stercoris]MDC2296784.1 hypothetical protein [Bacteroides stercoris]
MEIKNGIIIDGVLHVLKEAKHDYCLKCSLRNKCDNSDYLICDMFGAGHDDYFINCGKVTDIKIDKEE